MQFLTDYNPLNAVYGLVNWTLGRQDPENVINPEAQASGDAPDPGGPTVAVDDQFVDADKLPTFRARMDACANKAVKASLLHSRSVGLAKPVAYERAHAAAQQAIAFEVSVVGQQCAAIATAQVALEKHRTAMKEAAAELIALKDDPDVSRGKIHRAQDRLSDALFARDMAQAELTLARIPFLLDS